MSVIINILKIPYWLLSPFTQAKNFKTNPIIGARFLNILGLHVVRVMLAHTSAYFRWFLLSPMMPKEYRTPYRQNGFVAIKEFISADDIHKIRAEIAAYDGPAREMMQGDTATQRIQLNAEILSQSPYLKALCGQPRLKHYLNYTGAKITAPLLYIQRIKNGQTGNSLQGSGMDPQKNMHSDTFHPTMKAWLFLENVTTDMGPFTYVPGSNRMTFKRLKWEYRRSINAAKMADRYSEKGSLRAGPDDLAEMGLPSPKGLTAKAGTLVIANTNGFHGRGAAKDGASRLEIWAYSRHNPFNPLPGVALPFAGAIKHWALTLNARRADKKAAQKNGQPSWYLIPADKMVGDISATHTTSTIQTQSAKKEL